MYESAAGVVVPAHDEEGPVGGVETVLAFVDRMHVVVQPSGTASE
jgi:hypothetical protein